MAGCILYCAFSIVNHSKAFSPPRFEPSSAAPRSISLRMSGLSWPARRAGSDAIVAGSCAGSPTRRHRRGRRAKAHMSSHSSACAASSTISASGAGVLAIAAWPAHASVQKTTDARDAASAAYADANGVLVTPPSPPNDDEPLFFPFDDEPSRMRSIVASAARHADASAAAVGLLSRASLARRRATLRSPSSRPSPTPPRNAGAVAASSQSASATARKSAAARFSSAFLAVDAP